MKLRLFLFLCLIVLGGKSFSQTTVSQHKVYVPWIMGTGYEYEHSLFDHFTLIGRVDMRLAMGSGDMDEDFEFSYNWLTFQPRLHLETRYYYNLFRRHIMEKDTRNNSANFVSLNFSYDVPYGVTNIGNDPFYAYRTELNWGFRRNLNSITNYEFSLFWGFKYGNYSRAENQNPDGSTDQVIGEVNSMTLGFKLNIGIVF